MEIDNMDVDMCKKKEKLLTTLKVELENGDQNLPNCKNDFTENGTTQFFIKNEGSQVKLKSEESCHERSTHAGTNTCIEEEIFPISLSKVKEEEGNDQDVVKYENDFIECVMTNFSIKNEEINIKCEEITESESCVTSESQHCGIFWGNALSETPLDTGDEHSSDNTINISGISTELPIYKCEMCTYQSKIKRYLQYHMRRHSDIKPYECDVCFYKTKYKKSLQQHMYTHFCPSDRPVYKCNLCPYEAKHRQNIYIHVRTHKNPSEAKMYKCDLCPYQGIAVSYLNRHMLCHKSIDEVKVYECDDCKYKCKYKFRLAEHRLRKHKCTRKE